MPIASPIGFLDVVNATLRASQVETTSRLTVANTAATKNFSVGDRFHIDKDSVDPVSVTGNVVASGIKISNLTISPTFDLAAVSNVGNTTSNTLQFANATTGFTTTSNVEIGGNITLTSNAQVKVGSNVLAEYTGPHGRDPTTPLLKKFPEIVFDASKLDRNDTTNTYIQAGYTVSADSVFQTNRPHLAFDGIISYPENAALFSSHGASDNGFAPTTGLPISGVTFQDENSVSYTGHYIKLELPKKIKLSRVSFSSRENTYSANNDKRPTSGTILGSTDGTNWTLLRTFNDGELTWTSKTIGTYDVEYRTNITNIVNDGYFSYMLFLIEKIKTVNAFGVVEIGELEYYGTEEPAPPGDLSLDTTLKSTFNSVRSNNYVMYFDGEDPADGNVPKYLPSGSVKSITPNNVVFDATNNCWSLNGSTESNVTTGSLGLVGDAPHTVSTWINASNLEANALTQQLFSIGSGYDKALVKVDDTQIAANTWHNVTYAYQGEGGSKMTYVDGRKVEEAQVEDTFGEYPPFAMTGYKTGGYCVSSNFENATEARKPYNAFNAVGTGNRWQVDSGYSTSSPFLAVSNAGGLPSITDTNGTAHAGHWLKLELPHKLRLSRFKTTNFIHNQYQLKSYVILGSNDDANWTLLHSEADANLVGGASGGTHDTGIGGVTESFKYLKLLVKSKANGSNSTLMVQQVIFYGHKEGDLTRFPEPTRVLKYPHIAMTGPAQRGYVVTGSAYSHSPSSGDTDAPWRSFDGITGDNAKVWKTYEMYTIAGVYSPGSYGRTASSITDTNSTQHSGEYLVLETPHKIKLSSWEVRAEYAPRRIVDYAILGSDTNSSDTNKTGWTLLTSGTFAAQTDVTATVSSPTTAFKYHAIVVKSVTNNGDSRRSQIHEMKLYGTQQDTGTPAIVGGPFAGKVANFRVYDQYLGDERIQEIYDAQKDEFGHKKSSMTFYKGRIGVGTTEPEGALTVVDEPHTLEKFPARALSADYSYVEGDGCIKISTADSSGSSGSSGGYGSSASSASSGGSGFNVFDGLDSTCWSSTPTRQTRLSEEVDFGAWLKIQTHEPMSLKKAEIESKPDWVQVGGQIDGPDSGGQFGRAVACNHDGTRVIVGGYLFNSSVGKVIVYDWNGSAWTQVGNVLTGVASNVPQFGHKVAISGDGNIIAVAAPYEHSNGADAGAVRVYYLVGSTWTILPDSGSLTGDATSGLPDVFRGETAEDFLGYGGVILSYDGYTITMSSEGHDIPGKSAVGRARVFTYSSGTWSQKGTEIVGTTAGDDLGQGLDMSEDGNHIVIGTRHQATSPYVKVYQWGGTAWALKGSAITYSDASDGFGEVVSISNDGTVLAIGIPYADIADGAQVDGGGIVRVYHYESSAWVLKATLTDIDTTADEFGSTAFLSGDGKRLIVGASHEGANYGQIFTFEYTGGSWILRQPHGTIGATGSSNDDGYLGDGPAENSSSIALSRDGSTIVGGELGYDGNDLSNSGRVRVWNMPSNIKSIWGSNDDVNWTKITAAPTREEATSNVAGLAFGYDDRLEFKNLDNPNYYKYHAIIADAFTQLKEVKLFGIRNQGSSTLHDGTLTLTKKVTAPQLESTGIINMKGDYTEIRANSNVVTCFDRSKKLIKYPRVVMTSDSQSGYVASASSTYTSFNPYEAFDNEDPGSAAYWSGSTEVYNTNGTWGGSTAAAYTTNVEGVSKYGEWIQIQLPNKIKYNYSKIKAPSPAARQPRDGYILGSNDTTGAWTILHRFEDVTRSSTADLVTYTPPSEYIQFFQYFRLVIETINDGGLRYAGVNTWDIFGIPEYDPEADGVDVTIKSVPNVPNTDWLEVYYDAKDYTSVTTTVDNKTGVGAQDATITNSGGTITFNDEYKAWTFGGTDPGSGVESTRTDTFIATLPSTFQGNQVHSVSTWFRYEQTFGDDVIFSISPSSGETDNDAIGVRLNVGQDYQILYYHWSNDIRVNFPRGHKANTWYHMVVTYTGSITDVHRGKSVYIDGELCPFVSETTTGELNLTGSAQLQLARRNNGTKEFFGSIANFRLFNRALTSDEIYQLYAYQKEYFGHGDLGMTLKAGRLGIGTSEPRAALDVRGDLYAPGTIVQVENTIKLDTFLSAGGQSSVTLQDVPGMSVTINPKFQNSKFLVSFVANASTSGHAYLRLKRTQDGVSTEIAQPAAAGNRGVGVSYVFYFHNAGLACYNFEFLDPTPLTSLSPITYQLQGYTFHGSYYFTINRAYVDTDNNYQGRASSTISVKEICQ